MERELKLTRNALAELLPKGFKVLIITKSDLVLRDIDIIKRGNCSVSITITTLNEDVARRLEPNAPSPKSRLKAVKSLTENGIPCSVRVDPVIPGISDGELEKLIRAIAESGAQHIVASTYKAKRDNFNRVANAFPEFRRELNLFYWIEGERIGRAQYLQRELREDLLRQLKRLAEDFGMTYATCREGMPELKSGESCDGSHLIPLRIACRQQKLLEFRGFNSAGVL